MARPVTPRPTVRRSCRRERAVEGSLCWGFATDCLLNRLLSMLRWPQRLAAEQPGWGDRIEGRTRSQHAVRTVQTSRATMRDAPTQRALRGGCPVAVLAVARTRPD